MIALIVSQFEDLKQNIQFPEARDSQWTCDVGILCLTPVVEIGNLCKISGLSVILAAHPAET